MASPSERVDVSVVIPTYNRVEPTVAAVLSVLAQTWRPRDVVVVDDGSSEDVRAALGARLSALPVRFLEAPRTAHPGRARNLGVASADTEWVAFLDSDDSWHPEKLERQLSRAGQEAAAVCTNARRVADGAPEGEVIPALPQEIRFRHLVRHNLIVNSSVLLRRSALTSVGGVASSYLVRGCEDYATWLRVASSVSWLGIDEPLVDYADVPGASIRGSEEFATHAGQPAAWLDYLMWRREQGRPARVPERVVSVLLKNALLLEAPAQAQDRKHNLAD